MNAVPSPTDRLLEAWIAWDKSPGAEITTRRRLALIAELGLPSSLTHERIAAMRRRGYSTPDAVMSAVLELAPHREMKEAS